MIGVDSAPVVGVEKIARIDLKREHRPEEPGGIIARIVVLKAIDVIGHLARLAFCVVWRRQ
jgi:hypothetical protein